ncbi:MAG: hypothetical protein CSB55_05505 [Candidatus Cloacimonadota bacterium]|nr:MAG: hypothetical protein CSB55_05505 [Candidatus Cloacimonadota bacterium]
MSVEQQNVLVNYLNAGKALYVEGTNIGIDFAGTEFLAMLGIASGIQGEDEEITGGIRGIDDTFTAGKNYDYRDENPGQTPSYCIGRMNRLTAGTGTAILNSVNGDYVRAVANKGENYRAIGSTVITGALFDGESDNTKKNLFQLYLSFLFGQTEPECYSSEDEISFGNIDPGETPEINFFLQNQGENDLNITDVILDSDDFVLTGAESASLVFGESIPYSVQLNPNETGIFSVNIEIHSNDPEEPVKIIPVSATVQYPPQLSIPAEEVADIKFGETNYLNFNLENTGEADLSYWTRIIGLSVNASGDPDNYGYNWWKASDYPGELSEWNDISEIGDLHPMNGSNTFYNLELPFLFPFYGKLKTNVKVSSNGYLTFGRDGIDYSNDEIPNSIKPNDMIAPFWDDLKSNSGDLYSYFDEDGKKIIIQYTNWVFYNETGNLNFQVILHQNGDIEFLYGNMDGELNEATVGIENADADDGLQIAYNQDFVESNTSVFISPNASFIKLDDPQAIVEAGVPFTVNYAVDGNQLALNQSYNAEIEFYSNDPDDSLKTLPLTLNVIQVANDNDIAEYKSEANIYPNPFIATGSRANITISFSLPEDSPVEIGVYNIKGQKVYEQKIPEIKSGKHILELKSEFSERSVSGIYFVNLKTQTNRLNKKILLVK